MARLRRWQMARELAHLRLEQALEVARRQAAEARLAALQAQVQPHFIFNTLAALQHWVDEGDPRAAPLLRALTGFLRGSTELLARDSATLGDELPLVEHYLAVMQARWGERLRSRVDADAASRAVQLPPGLLLTLVENAVEHGAGARLEGGEVRVRVQVDGARCQVEVSDNGPGLAPGWQEGVGLGNVRQRLAHRFGDRARLVLEDAAPGVRARIELDLREEAPHGH
jgi:LytS/YehU family sensor histidine kinase